MDNDHPMDNRTDAIVNAINTHLDALPAHPTFLNLRAWSNTLNDRVFDGNLLDDLIDKADDFEQYLLKY